MALKKFIGARYAPEFAGAWSNSKQYAALSVVYADNRSYVSRKTVPAGTPITNTEFWIQSSDWNAQVAEYNLKVEGYNANVEQYNRNVQDYSAEVRGFYADTLHSFDTKADMQADRTLALGETLLTCGDKKIGDGGGSFYQVVSETSVTAVALDNGLFAEPFEFQPYDYSQFQQEVEGYKDSTTRVYNTQHDMVADIGINTGNILMTTGALEQGDGQGSFWNVTDNQEEGSVLLQNGKYAKKFNVASVDASGTLLFNNKGNQVAIWGVKAGGETVNVPVSYSLGETRSVFVAVEYDSDNTNATVNLVVSGPVSFTKAFAWSDASVTSDKVKTVIYAITLHSKGNNVYTGAQVAASYLTTLERFVQTLTTSIPNTVLANIPWSGGGTGAISHIHFYPNTAAIIKKITFKTKFLNNGTPTFQVKPADFNINQKINVTANTVNTVNYTRKFIASPDANIDNDFVFGTDGYVGVELPNNTTGNYGIFRIENEQFNGTIEYEPFDYVFSSVQTNNYSEVWSAGAISFDFTFTINSEIALHSITTNGSLIGSDPSLTFELKTGNDVIISHNTLYAGPNPKLNDEAIIDIILAPGTYTFKFISDHAITRPSEISGVYGPFTFTAGYYQGTIKYKVL